MSQWDVDPVGVRAVLVHTAEAAGSLVGDARTWALRMESALHASGGRLVTRALSGFALQHQTTFGDLLGRTGLVMHAAGSATAAYLRGDAEMAAAAQAGAWVGPADDRADALHGPR